jgi:hypothetical protein
MFKHVLHVPLTHAASCLQQIPNSLAFFFSFTLYRHAMNAKPKSPPFPISKISLVTRSHAAPPLIAVANFDISSRC